MTAQSQSAAPKPRSLVTSRRLAGPWAITVTTSTRSGTLSRPAASTPSLSSAAQRSRLTVGRETPAHQMAAGDQGAPLFPVLDSNLPIVRLGDQVQTFKALAKTITR